VPDWLQLDVIDNHFDLHTIEEYPADDVEQCSATIGQIQNGVRLKAERINAWSHSGEAVVGPCETPPTTPNDRGRSEEAEVVRRGQHSVVDDKCPLYPVQELDRPGGSDHFLVKDFHIALCQPARATALWKIRDGGKIADSKCDPPVGYGMH
jgi:hypothetical protein